MSLVEATLETADPNTGGQRRSLQTIEARHGDYVVSIKEAASILTVCTKTVRNMIDAGRIKALRVSERRMGILASELARYMGEA